MTFFNSWPRETHKGSKHEPAGAMSVRLDRYVGGTLANDLSALAMGKTSQTGDVRQMMNSGSHQGYRPKLCDWCTKLGGFDLSLIVTFRYKTKHNSCSLNFRIANTTAYLRRSTANGER